MLEALETRRELTKLSLHRPDLGDEMDHLSVELSRLRPHYEGDERNRAANKVLSVVANLVRDDSRLTDTWDRLVGEGALLRLGETLNYAAGAPDAYNKTVDLLRDLREFIFETYQQIPIKRLRTTLRRVMTLLGSQAANSP